MSSLGDIKLGLPLAIAIAIHNIPEGMAIAGPIYAATGNKKKAFSYSLLAGVAEPVGALIGLLFLFPYLNPGVLGLLFGFVAGVMVFISFDELLPVCFDKKQDHTSIMGVISGMILVALSLRLL